MPAPSTIDVTTPFDPTGYQSITGAQLEQFGSGITPYTDKGLIIVSFDGVNGNPQVPNALTTTKWQNYIWTRISAASVSVYVWNPSAAVDATYLQWQGINVAGIPLGSIVDAMIAANTITSDKIASVNGSTIIGSLPASILSTLISVGNTAGGDLTGTYPNPSVAALAITAAKIAVATITGSQIANNTVVNTNLAPSANALTMLRTKGDLSAVEWFTPPTVLMNTGFAMEANISTNKKRAIQVNTAGNGYEYASGTILQLLTFQSSGAAKPAPATAIASTTTAPTLSNTALFLNFGAGTGALTITPKYVGSTINITANINCSCSTPSNVGIFLYDLTNTTFRNGTYFTTVSGVQNGQVTLSYSFASASLLPVTYNVYIGATAGTVAIDGLNGVATSSAWNGVYLSTVTITETL